MKQNQSRELVLCNFGIIACETVSISAGTSTFDPDFYYTGDSPALTFTTDFTTTTAGCEQVSTFSCSNTGLVTDMCDQGFDATTGDYTFALSDYQAYPEGLYTFTITATQAGASATT